MYHFFVVALIVTAMVVTQSFEIPENIHLKPRTQAPAFKAKAVINDKFINVALADYIAAKKWTVLLFYPFDYTFVCPVSNRLLQNTFDLVSHRSNGFTMFFMTIADRDHLLQ